MDLNCGFLGYSNDKPLLNLELSEDDSDDTGLSENRCVKILKKGIKTYSEKMFHVYLTLNYTTRTNDFARIIQDIPHTAKLNPLLELFSMFAVFDNMLICMNCLTMFKETDRQMYVLNEQEYTEITDKAVEIQQLFLSLPSENHSLLREHSLIFLSQEDRLSRCRKYINTFFYAFTLLNSIERNGEEATIVNSVCKAFDNEVENRVLNISTKIVHIFWETPDYNRELLVQTALDLLKFAMSKQEVWQLTKPPVKVNPRVLQFFIKNPATVIANAFLDTHKDRREHLVQQFLFMISNTHLMMEMLDFHFEGKMISNNICYYEVNLSQKDVLNTTYYQHRLTPQFKSISQVEQRQIIARCKEIWSVIYNVKYPLRKHLLEIIGSKIIKGLAKERKGRVNTHCDPVQALIENPAQNAYPRRLQDIACLKLAVLLIGKLQLGNASSVALKNIIEVQSYEKSRPIVNFLRNIALKIYAQHLVKQLEMQKKTATGIELTANVQQLEEPPTPSTSGMKGDL